MAGTGSWLSFLIATLGMVLVAGNIAALARRHPLAGSYFVYIGRTLGPLAGMIAGWSMVAAYLATAVASVIGGGIVLGNVLDEIGLPGMKPSALLFDLVFVRWSGRSLGATSVFRRGSAWSSNACHSGRSS
jgi:amino acid transporter